MPSEEKASRVASVPYDVVSTAEARVLAKGNDDSFLHVVRPEIDLGTDADPYGDAVYQLARTNLESFRARGLLAADTASSIYLYRLTWRGRSQVGVVCCCEVEQYRNDLIKRHEFTRPDKENDRVRHLVETGTHAEGVILSFHDQPDIAALMEEDLASPPLFDFTAEDGVEHALWRVRDADAYVAAFEQLDALYIADGHHRSAAAERAPRSHLVEQHGGSTMLKTEDEDLEHDGDDEFMRFMAVCFPASQLEILAYNRVVKDRAGLSSAQFMAALAESRHGRGGIGPDSGRTRQGLHLQRWKLAPTELRPGRDQCRGPGGITRLRPAPEPGSGPHPGDRRSANGQEDRIRRRHTRNRRDRGQIGCGRRRLLDASHDDDGTIGGGGCRADHAPEVDLVRTQAT